MLGLRNTVILTIFIVTLLPGCKSESYKVDAAMKQFANMWPAPRTRRDCSAGEEIIREYILRGRDKGVSVNELISRARIGGMDNYFAAQLGNLLVPIWDSKESATSLSSKYMKLCVTP